MRSSYFGAAFALDLDLLADQARGGLLAQSLHFIPLKLQVMLGHLKRCY